MAAPEGGRDPAGDEKRQRGAQTSEKVKTSEGAADIEGGGGRCQFEREGRCYFFKTKQTF